MTKEQFINKYSGRVVHCDTEEKAKELLALAHSFGWTWGNKSLLDETYWGDRERICYRIKDDKTMRYADLDFYKSQYYEIVEFESEKNKIKKTKQVFDLGLFVDNVKNQRSEKEIINSIQMWALRCHGLTVKKMNELGYSTWCSWMKEVEVFPQLTPHEIEVLKSLKVLEFNWLTRDQNGILYAHVIKPKNNIMSYSVFEKRVAQLENYLFDFITNEDEEATSIDELLSCVEGER